MRPLELTLRNFRSYAGEEAVFDLRERRLVGIVGPIGSGKSSLLDAISFALFGKTPTAGSSTKALIHQRSADGAVRFRFEAEGEIWEVVRSLRRKGQSQHALYRYASDDEGADRLEQIVNEGDVNARLQGLLGLDFDAFGRSVMLAQGRFAEFLNARPAARDAVLKGVFGYDRVDVIREKAKERAASLAEEVASIAGRLDHLGEVVARLEATKARQSAAELRLEQLRKVEVPLGDLDARIDERRVQLGEITAAAARLAVDQRNEVAPGAVARLLDEAAEIGDRRVAVAEQLEVAITQQRTSEQHLAHLRSNGRLAEIDEAGRLIVSLEALARTERADQQRTATLDAKLNDQRAAIGRLSDDLAAAQRAVEAANDGFKEAEGALEEAYRELHRRQHDDMATTLREELAAGDACPVCGHEVDELPGSESSDVDEARRAVETKRTLRATAEQNRTAALNHHVAIENRLVSAEHALTAAQAELAAIIEQASTTKDEIVEVTDRLSVLLGPGDPAALVQERRAAVTAADDDASAARRTVDQLRTRHDQVIADEQQIGKRVVVLHRRLIELAGILDVDPPGDDADHIELRAATDRLLAEQQRLLDHLRTQRTDGEADLESLSQQRMRLLSDAGIDGPLDVLIATEARSLAHLAEDAARDSAEIAAAAELDERRTVVDAEKRHYDRIARDLTDSRFVRYLLDDERARLAELGSDHFMRLSSGRYRFSEDGAFDIVDLTAADTVRKASSLSGGETFLASLALALALAEMVARTGGRLDAFFLDEGFGSLDPEHLDLAMEGIEALVSESSNRIVLVVSHVPEMRERIEDLIELDRDALTGDSRILSGATRTT